MAKGCIHVVSISHLWGNMCMYVCVCDVCVHLRGDCVWNVGTGIQLKMNHVHMYNTL